MHEKRRKAAGIQYFKGNKAIPVITAIGEGKFADMIIKAAVENGVEVVENSKFHSASPGLKQGMEIPEVLYETVSEILSFLVTTNKIK